MRETYIAEGKDPSIVRLFTFRYQEGLSEKTDRILYKGKDYELYGVNDINEEHRFIKVWGKHLCR